MTSWKIPIEKSFYHRLIRKSDEDSFIKNNFNYKTDANGNMYFDFFYHSKNLIEESGLFDNYKNNENMIIKVLSNPLLYIKADNPDMQAAANLIIDNASCGFMKDDRRCYIHSTYGAGFLSGVCLTYPRIYYKTIRGIERGLSYSCPSAFRMLTDELDIININEMTKIILPENIRSIGCNPAYFEMEDAILNEIDLYNGNNFLELFDVLINHHCNYRLTVFDILTNVYSKNLNDIIKYLFNSSAELFPAFTTEDLLNKIEASGIERFIEIESTLYSNFEKANLMILKNYLKNYFFTKSFFLFRESITDSILMALLIYRIIKYNITVCYLYNSINPDSNYLLNLVSQIEKNLMHNSKISSNILINISDWY